MSGRRTIAPRADEVTAADAARLLGVSVPTVYRWLRDGRLKGRRTSTRRYVKLADVEAIRARQRRIARMAAP